MKNWYERKIEFFVEKEKRVVSIIIIDLSNENIERILKMFFLNIRGMFLKEDYYGIVEGFFEYKDILEIFDRVIVEFDELNEYVERVINVVFEEGVKRVVGVFYIDYNKFYLIMSNGVEVFDEGMGIEISVRVFIGDFESGYGMNFVRVFKKFDFESVGRKVGEIVRLVRNLE